MSGRDADRIEDALPDLADMAERDGADLRAVGSELRCDHPHHATRSTNGENLCISRDDDVWHCKRHRHGGGKLAWVAMSAGVVDCGELDNGSIPSGLFRDVLEVAADRAGVELHGAPDDESDRAHRTANDLARKKVAEYYHDCLDAHGKRAELRDRYGFSDQLIDESMLGYAPPEGIDHDLRGDVPVNNEVLTQIGVLTDGDAPYFRDRFIFPYWVRDGGDRRVRYFTARARDTTRGGPKYLKLPNDGIDEEAAEEPPFGIDSVIGERTVVLTEGVTDALTLHDAGIAAVSPVTTHISGDALSEFATRLAGKDVYVVYDEDAGTNAGIQGAARDAHVLSEADVDDACVARLPCRPNESVDVNEWFQAGHDADDFRETVLAGETFPAGVAWWAWGGGSPWRVFADAIDELGYDPSEAVPRKDDDGNTYHLGVEDLAGEARTLSETRRRFYNSGETKWSASTHKEAYHHVIWWVLSVRGEFFTTDAGQVYYYHAPENAVVSVASDTDAGHADAQFAHLVADTFGITTGDWGRSLVDGVARRAVFEAPERPTGRTAVYDADAQELYVNRFDGHYYALDGDGVDLRRNGTDVFFVTNTAAEPYEYLDPDERASLPDRVPGERPMFTGAGDTLQRVICNRINFDEHANLGPSLQRSQLYLHLHALAFVSEFDGKPIMAWVGQKGSGKTVVLRSIGKFLYGPEWSESAMPSKRDDFVTKVSNQTLAAIDNYDDEEDWANDMLAAMATGASVEKRELYTTNQLAEAKPECFLALTSRDPPFRRDDVADRCLVFRVDRVEGEFISETEYLKQVAIYRDELWSQYIDNLNSIMQVRQSNHEPTRTTTHRMADWAIFARDAAEALDVGHVDELLGGMQTERAFFALENEPLRVVIEEWLANNPDGGTYDAGSLLGEFEAAADEADVPWEYSTSRGLSSALSSLSDELAELFDMEIIQSTSGANMYRWPGGGTQYLLGYNNFEDGGDGA